MKAKLIAAILEERLEIILNRKKWRLFRMFFKHIFLANFLAK